MVILKGIFFKFSDGSKKYASDLSMFSKVTMVGTPEPHHVMLKINSVIWWVQCNITYLVILREV